MWLNLDIKFESFTRPHLIQKLLKKKNNSGTSQIIFQVVSLHKSNITVVVQQLVVKVEEISKL